MILSFLIVALLGYLFIAIKSVKHVGAPPVILGLVFLVSYVFIMIAYGSKESNVWFYICYLLSATFFLWGFLITTTKRKLYVSPISANIYFNKKVFFVIWWVEIIFSSIQLAKMLIASRGSNYNLWSSIRLNYQSNAITDFLFLFETVFFFVIVAIFLINRTKHNMRRAIMSATPLIPYILSSHRGVWFMFVITLVFMLIYIYKPNNIKVLKTGVIAILCLISVILISSFWKYGKWYSSPEELIRFVLNAYFSSPFVAFKQYMESNPDLLMGQNTFRFFIAVFYQLGIGSPPVDVIQPFTSVYGYPTNVYTGLHYYAADFGMWWAYVIEFALGLLYGFLYSKTFSKGKVNLICLIGLCMLMYPLINQFFDDKYFSILSEWIKYFSILIFLTQKFFIKQHGAKNAGST